MHWTERQRARVAIGLALRSRGWKLYGFHEDRSDPMTDYYAPASWDGVAEKDGCVVVVDVSKANNYVLSRSGGRQTQRQARGDDCPHCHGSGLEPDGWTFEQAQADPRGFNHTWTGQGVALLPDVVSPLHFDGQGRQMTVREQGRRSSRSSAASKTPFTPDPCQWAKLIQPRASPSRSGTTRPTTASRLCSAASRPRRSAPA